MKSAIACTLHLISHLMGKMRSVYRIMVVNPAGKKSLVRPRYSWEDNNKMDLRESGFGGVE
jgi:hypothetical protein